MALTLDQVRALDACIREDWGKRSAAAIGRQFDTSRQFVAKRARKMGLGPGFSRAPKRDALIAAFANGPITAREAAKRADCTERFVWAMAAELGLQVKIVNKSAAIRHFLESGWQHRLIAARVGCEVAYVRCVAERVRAQGGAINKLALNGPRSRRRYTDDEIAWAARHVVGKGGARVPLASIYSNAFEGFPRLAAMREAALILALAGGRAGAA